MPRWSAVAASKPDATSDSNGVESVDDLLTRLDQDDRTGRHPDSGAGYSTDDRVESLEDMLKRLDQEQGVDKPASQGSLPSLEDAREEPPLVQAVLKLDHFQVQSLCRDKADPNTQSLSGASVLSLAADSGDASLTALLLGWGAAPEQEPRAGKQEAIRLLLDIFQNKATQSDEERAVLADLDPGSLAQVRKRLMFRPPFALGGAAPMDCLEAEATTVFEASDDHDVRLHSLDSLRPVLVLEPKECQVTAVVIILHGFLQSGRMMEQLARELSWALPHARMVAPTAPTRGSGFGYGPSWCDPVNLPEAAQNLQEGRSELLKVLGQFCQDVPPHRVVLLGFSMGGSLAAYTALKVPRCLAGLVILGSEGIIQLRESNDDWPGAPGLPVLQCHGDSDGLVPLQRARETAEHLRNLGCQVRFTPHEGIGHHLSAAMVAEVLAWISEKLTQ